MLIACQSALYPEGMKLVEESELKHRVGAYGVITTRDSILLEQSTLSTLHWFPGGGVDPGETIEQGLHREIFEETGIRLESVQPLTVTRHAFYDDVGKQGYDQISHFFMCTPAQTEVSGGEIINGVLIGKPVWYSKSVACDLKYRAYGREILMLAGIL